MNDAPQVTITDPRLQAVARLALARCESVPDLGPMMRPQVEVALAGIQQDLDRLPQDEPNEPDGSADAD